MRAIVVRLSDLTFLSSEDLSGACSQAELGEKIIKQFTFLTGDLRVTITDGTARIEYRQPNTEKMIEAQHKPLGRLGASISSRHPISSHRQGRDGSML